MVQFVKLGLVFRGSPFGGNGILVKHIAANDVAFILILKDDGRIPLTEFAASERGSLSIGGIQFLPGDGSLFMVPLSSGEPIDSFETVLLKERLRDGGPLVPYNVTIMGDVMEAESDIVFDRLFNGTVTSNSGGNDSIWIKPGYTQDELYTGFSGYHHNQSIHRFNRPINNSATYRIGAELEFYALNEQCKRNIVNNPSNYLQFERDGSLSENINGISGLGIEMKTIPLTPDDAKNPEFWMAIMKFLARNAVSKGHSTTGLHVHISKEIMGRTREEQSRNIDKLCMFYTYFVEDDSEASAKNQVICGRAQGYAGSLSEAKTQIADFCKKVGFDKIAEGSEDAYMEMASGVRDRVGHQRWDINLQHLNDYGTIEFRKADGRISKTRVAAVCIWWEQMCIYCRDTHPRDFNFDNFFNKVCREYPAVAYFFQADEER